MIAVLEHFLLFPLFAWLLSWTRSMFTMACEVPPSGGAQRDGYVNQVQCTMSTFG